MIIYKIDVENEYSDWSVDEKKISDFAGKVFNFFASQSEINSRWCLNGYEYNTISFDILFCDGEKTHIINRDYREKDYPADIITFALFADSDESERIVHEFEINLGEIIIALDKIKSSAEEKNISKDTELMFMISHGIMHLLGFEHDREEEFNFVVEQQKIALESMGIKYDKI